MKYRFFKDDFNGRFTWGWPDDGYVTSDSAEIEHLMGLGVRGEEVKQASKKEPVKKTSSKQVKKTSKKD